jgi:uncharacterized membrane protein
MKTFIIILLAVFMALGSAHSHSSVNAVTSISGGGRKPKKRVPTQIVLAAFNDVHKAEEAAELLMDAAFAGILHFRNLAVIRKDEWGAVNVEETGDMTVGYAATVGMFLGGLSLLLLGPAGVVAGGAAGALVGGAGEAILNQEAEQQSDKSVGKKRFTELGKVLKPGSAAIVVIFEEVMVDKRRTKNVRMKLTQDIVLANLAEKIRLSLKRSKDVAYAISVDKDGIRAVRMVFVESATDIMGMFVTSEGVTVGRATRMPEGIVYEVAETTEEGASYRTGTVDTDEL